MSVYIYSTMSQDVAYTFFKEKKHINDLHEVERKILIKGGAGVITKNLVTPIGTVTKITDEEYELLEQNTVFQQHVENGFIVVQKTKSSLSSITKNMQERDRGSQLIKADLKKEGMPKVLENRI